MTCQPVPSIPETCVPGPAATDTLLRGARER